MKKLDHKFGDDGVFWMTYEDMLETFKFVHRTRLFDDKWTVIQQWTSCDVSWFTGFLRNKFLLTVEKPGTVIIVLAQVGVFSLISMSSGFPEVFSVVLSHTFAPSHISPPHTLLRPLTHCINKHINLLMTPSWTNDTSGA